MKVALVHDYLNEYGGAERVLEVLAEMYPHAPIYTAFFRKGSQTYERFKDRQIIPSWAHHVPGFSGNLHSPLRFLAPSIWQSFDFSKFDVVITSASWYITKGMRKGPRTAEICYCHTPPRHLYGYDTSWNWKKYMLVRWYAAIVNKHLRQYDFESAQRVDQFVANSKNVQERIKKFYRRDAEVIYPPVQLKIAAYKKPAYEYYLVISRLVGAKGIHMAVEAANQLKVPLKVVGVGGGYGREAEALKKMAGPTVRFLGFVDDEQLAQLYAGAKAFLALAADEDFGMTPVEAMMAGTPVVAFNGGGYRETVIDGKTGKLFDEYSTEGLVKAIKESQGTIYLKRDILRHAQQFSRETFKKNMGELVERVWEKQCKNQ